MIPLRSLADTRVTARLLARHTRPGDLLLLSGPLGAGKTTLTALLAEELGTEARVSSPTYTLVHEYPTAEGKLVHIDAYRLPDARSLLELGLDEYLDDSRLVVVEWGEGLRKTYQDAWLVRLERHGEARSVAVSAPEGRRLP